MPINLENLLSVPVLLYFLIVILGQILLFAIRKKSEADVTAQRKKVGLDDKILVDNKVRLDELKSTAWLDAVVLLVTVFIAPVAIAAYFADNAPELGLVFLAVLAWVLFSATDVIRNFLGGIAYRGLVAFNQPFQVGDRVTLNGYSGKVLDIGIFFLRINTIDDDLVSIPTASLWGQSVVSANAGDRASLCKMTFHLSPSVTAEQRKQTEDAIWDAIQKSVYWEFNKPLQIFVEQHKGEIILIAKAYVASTYNEPLFRSDVYQAFLDFADEYQVLLANPAIQ